MNETEKERVLRETLARALTDITTEVAEPISVLKKRARQMRLIIWTLVWLKLLTLGTITVLFVTLNTVSDNQREIKDIQRRTSDEVLCPLYGAFLAAKDNPVPDNIKNDPKQRKEREDAFRIIDEGADALGCTFKK